MAIATHIAPVSPPTLPPSDVAPTERLTVPSAYTPEYFLQEGINVSHEVARQKLVEGRGSGVAAAFELVCEIHDDQIRRDGSMHSVGHVFPVTMMFLGAFGDDVTDEHIAFALTHDIAEDSDMTVAEVVNHVGLDIARPLVLISKPKLEECDGDKELQTKRYLDQLREAGEDEDMQFVMNFKVIDSIANMASDFNRLKKVLSGEIGDAEGVVEKIAQYLQESREQYGAIFEGYADKNLLGKWLKVAGKLEEAIEMTNRSVSAYSKESLFSLN